MTTQNKAQRIAASLTEPEKAVVLHAYHGRPLPAVCVPDVYKRLCRDYLLANMGSGEFLRTKIGWSVAEILKNGQAKPFSTTHYS